MSLKRKYWLTEALQCFGGFVRYYDTTEPLPELAKLVAAGYCRNILACCAGGDQALTILGAGSGIRTLWAVDINPAQLFILAAKAQFLNKKRSAPFIPSFKQLQRTYPQRIVAAKKDIRQMSHFYNISTGQLIIPPAVLSEKYAVVHDDEMFVKGISGPYWQNEASFVARVRRNLPALRFLRKDIMECFEYFKNKSLDIIYFSDIYWQGTTGYHLEKLEGLLKVLRSGARVISYNDPGEKFCGQGISPAEVLAHYAQKYSLRVNKEKSGYLVLQRE